MIYDQYSAGAENDLSQATNLARKMVAHWGMSKRLGPVAYHLSEEHPFLGKEIHEQRQFSEHTAQLIDEEVANLLHHSADRATSILTENRDKLVAIAEALVEREILDESEITELIGPPAADNADAIPRKTDDSLPSTPSRLAQVAGNFNDVRTLCFFSVYMMPHQTRSRH